VKDCALDHADAFPAASTARACQKYEPSRRPSTVQLPIPPAPTPAEEPLAATVEQAASVQTWNESVPPVARIGAVEGGEQLRPGDEHVRGR